MRFQDALDGSAERPPGVVSEVPPWRDALVIAAAHEWMTMQVQRAGRVITGPITEAHARPWSLVYRAASSHGRLYLKLTGPSQAHEAALTALIAPGAVEIIPEVLAVDAKRGWLLLGDAVLPLRETLAGDALLDAWAAFLPRYAELQRTFVGREKELLATGTPDRRLDRLATSLEAVIGDAEIFAPLAGDSLAMPHNELVALLPRLPRLCDELAALGIGPTVQHNDLHDWNLFSGSRGQVVALDWGDACVTHPFLSLWTVERAAADRLGAAGEAAIDRLRESYLDAWTGLAPKRALRSAARIGATLGGVTRALCWHRTATLNPSALSA